MASTGRHARNCAPDGHRVAVKLREPYYTYTPLKLIGVSGAQSNTVFLRATLTWISISDVGFLYP